MKSCLCRESIFASSNNLGSRTGCKITKAFYNNWLATRIRISIQAMQLLFVADSLAPTFRIMAAVFGFIFGSFRILAETVLVTKEAATLL